MSSTLRTALDVQQLIRPCWATNSTLRTSRSVGLPSWPVMVGRRAALSRSSCMSSPGTASSTRGAGLPYTGCNLFAVRGVLV